MSEFINTESEAQVESQVQPKSISEVLYELEGFNNLNNYIEAGENNNLGTIKQLEEQYGLDSELLEQKKLLENLSVDLKKVMNAVGLESGEATFYFQNKSQFKPGEDINQETAERLSAYLEKVRRVFKILTGAEDTDLKLLNQYQMSDLGVHRLN